MNTTQWIKDNAQPLTLDPAASLDDLTALDDIVSDATVVGVGETTRASHEVMNLSLRVFRYLVERKGFRALAIEDDETVWAELRRWTRTRAGNPADLLANAWAPWRTQETLDILAWIADYNAAHPHGPFTIFGLVPASARAVHYDLVTEHVQEHDPGKLAELRAHYDTIRTAHDINEHVQLAKGLHPGRPFTEHAAEALALVNGANPTPEVLAAARLINDFHAGSVANGHDFKDAAQRSFQALQNHRETTGAKIIYWEGMAHIAKHGGTVQAMNKTVDGVGTVLHRRYGKAYATILIGFDSGQIHAGVRVPPPPHEFSDAVFAAAPSPYLLDTHAPADAAVRTWLQGAHELRIIAGIYQPEHDRDHHFEIASLPDNYDAILRVGDITPTQLLG